MDPMDNPPINQLIDKLNTVSLQAFGPYAPVYYCAPGSSARSCTVHCIRSDVSRYLPSEEVWARGEAQSVAGRIQRAILHAKDQLS
jgi:hypothetical protein